MELTQEQVKLLFDYHEDGYLIWKIKPRQNVNIGDRAGHLGKYNGEKCRYKVKIKGKSYFVSRIIFLYHKGYLPEMVDHKDRNKLNDRIDNLRAASQSDNQKNVLPRKGSSSKYLGPYYHKKNKYWCACIRVNDKSKHLGCFETEEQAAEAYNQAAKLYHGEFANLNVIPTT